MNSSGKFELISMDGRPVNGAQFWLLLTMAIAVIIAFSVWNPTNGTIFLGVLIVGTFIGPFVPIVNLIANHFPLLSAVAAGLAVTTPATSASGETDLVYANGLVGFGLWVALTICGFLLASGSQTLWWSWLRG
jgi:hypothetical protein